MPRLNKFIAQSTGLSRRAADAAITAGRIQVNGQPAYTGQNVESSDQVTLDDKLLVASDKKHTIMLNKPVGYVCSRNGQGNPTIYDLLPAKYHHLKPVGRLDKDSSGLLLLTNDGKLAHQLTHPSFAKQKTYLVGLDRNLDSTSMTKLKHGVMLDDGVSKLDVRRWTIDDRKDSNVQRLSSNVYLVRMHEGRNRQIRRTFAALDYQVTRLHRTHFGPHELSSLESGQYKNSN